MAYQDTCEIHNTDNNRTVNAEILDYKKGDTLSVSIDRTIKLILKWNGKVYVGNSAGMEFTSFGPQELKY